MQSRPARSQHSGNRFLQTALALLVPGLLLASCDSRPQVEVEGPLTVTMAMGSFDPNRGRSFGGTTVMVEYEPGKSAIIRTGPDTEFVNLQHSEAGTTYALGQNYRIRGYESEPVTTKQPDGTEVFTTPQGVDRWIEATQVELLEPAE